MSHENDRKKGIFDTEIKCKGGGAWNSDTYSVSGNNYVISSKNY